MRRILWYRMLIKGKRGGGKRGLRRRGLGKGGKKIKSELLEGVERI